MDQRKAAEQYSQWAAEAGATGLSEAARAFEDAARDQRGHVEHFSEQLERLGEEAARQALQEMVTDEELLLHSIPYIEGSPGLVVDEARAKATSCRCVEYKPGKHLCWSKGVIGTLTDEQERAYCPRTIKVERPGTVARMRKWQEAVDTCKAELARIPLAPGEERITTWLRCMSRELRASAAAS